MGALDTVRKELWLMTFPGGQTQYGPQQTSYSQGQMTSSQAPSQYGQSPGGQYTAASTNQYGASTGQQTNYSQPQQGNNQQQQQQPQGQQPPQQTSGPYHGNMQQGMSATSSPQQPKTLPNKITG